MGTDSNMIDSLPIPEGNEVEPQKQRGTTIWVDIETSYKISEYCQKHGIDKKSFVRMAIEWIVEGNIDLTSETKYWPARMADKNDKQDIPAIRSQIQLTLSSLESLPDLISNRIIEEIGVTNKVISESATDSNKTILEAIRQQESAIEAMTIEINNHAEIEKMRQSIRMAVEELKRCKGLFAKPNQVIIDNLSSLIK